MAIEHIGEGVQVYAYDFASNKTVTRRVQAIYQGATRCWVDIDLDAGTLRATRSHPIWVEPARSWVNALALKPGSEVRLQDGRPANVKRTVARPLEQEETTYNLHVEGVNNFFAGELGVLVHNGTPLGQPGHNVYVLVRNGQIYYVGRFGPGESVATVTARHQGTPKNARLRSRVGARFDPAQGDSIRVVRRNVTYAEARRLEHELCVRNRTFIGKGRSWRGNRIYPMSPRRMPAYYTRC